MLVFIFRYASLYFVVGIESGDNELITLEIIHRYVELLDKYFGNVSHVFHSWHLLVSTVESPEQCVKFVQS